ncbi:hypothetical protein [Novosphingobium sp.]|uniref:hypothetical protein n=1 Tax=Novosphingobium sp. TaxID=1874826 RepID=UPI003341E107
MKHTSKWLGVASTAVLAAFGATSAHATGTLAGTTITNTASISYSVSNIAQTAATTSNSVVVDRKVTFTLANVGATTTVTPGQGSLLPATAAYDTFTLTNNSNDTLDFALAGVNQATGATAQHSGTDAFDVSGITYYIDTNSNGVFDAGDAAITWVDEVAPDTSKTIFALANVPLTVTNTQVSGIVLTASAELGGTSSTQGALLTNSNGAAWIPGTVQTVFNDTAGVSDSANDGKYSAKGDFTVYAPVLTLSKLSTIISDPVNGTSFPKAIPGATMEYCVVVQNATGGAPTTALAISDPLPTTVTYLSAYGIYLNSTYSAGTCGTGTLDSGANSSFAAATSGNNGTINGTLNNVSAGGAIAMRFRVTIN